MLNGKFRGKDIGSGTARLEVDRDAEGRRDEAEPDMAEAESCMSRSAGHCMTMGTASTMASMVEALGMGLPTQRGDSRRRFAPQGAGAHGRPAHRRDGARGPADVEDPDARRRSRTRSWSTARSAARPTRSCTCSRSPVASASSCRSTTGTGSAATMPCLVDLMPSGKYLMEDFYYAGGLPVVHPRDRQARCTGRR